MTKSAEPTKVINAMLAMQRYPWEQGVCAQALYEYGREDLYIPMAYDAVKGWTRMDAWRWRAAERLSRIRRRPVKCA